MSNQFPKAILHIDGDAFFASCEIAQDERLRGKPVVTGQDKGIATAVTYAAKALGVTRGMPIYMIKKEFPQVIVTQSHYDIYRIYSRRMYEIVRRYTPYVEEYSVDECFGDLTDEDATIEDLTRIAWSIKRDLEQDLGMTFSIGLAPSKTLAKVASKARKPAGFTIMPMTDIHAFLEKVDVGNVWGIGGATSMKLRKQGITTALEFINKPEWWMKENLAKPYKQIWYELQGRCLHNVHSEVRDSQKSIMKTRTFGKTMDKNYIFSELCRNVERACSRLRAFNLLTREVSFYLKTQRFQYKWTEFRLDTKTSAPTDIISAIKQKFNEVYKPHVEYRSSGVVLRDISPESSMQSDLFNKSENTIGEIKLFKTIDEIVKKFGSQALFLAGSMIARKERLRLRGEKLRLQKVKEKLQDVEADFLKLGIPSWGEVR